MKKNLFMVAAVALMALVSCNKEVTPSEEIAPVGETVTFSAYADGADTKAVLDGKVSKWENGDKITIHNGTKGYKFSTTDEGVKANFTYTGTDFSGEKFVAIYPASAGYPYSVDFGAMTVNAHIPTWQEAVVGSYHRDAALSVAYTEDETLYFMNAVALLKFTVQNEDVKNVTFFANDESAVSGNVKVTLSADGSEVSSVVGLPTSNFAFEPEQNKVYLVPNAWTSDNARFAAYFYGDGDGWVNMSDPDNDGVYEAGVPTEKNYTHVIFCRMNPSINDNNWDNKWNQTIDLSLASGQVFTFQTWEDSENDNKSNGMWQLNQPSLMTYVELYAKGEESLQVGQTYYMAVVPQVYAEGFSVQLQVAGAEKTTIKSLASSYEIKPNTILDLGTLKFVEPKKERELQFLKQTVTVSLDDQTISSPTLTGVTDGGVSYTSSDTSVATVDNEGVVTVIAEGTTTITASAAETDAYLAGSASYELIVEQGSVVKYSDVYVCISDLNWSNVYLKINSGSQNKLTENVTVSGKKYYKTSVEANQTYTFVYSSGTAENSATFKIEVSDVTVTDDIYYRLSARGAIKVDPNDVSTFGYAIYVFDQKNKNVAPNLYAWEDNGAWNTQYNKTTFASWPGVAFVSDCKYQTTSGSSPRHYYYYEIPTTLYNTSFKFIVNKKGQTPDLQSKTVTGDLYVGYWYNNANDNGFWTNTPMTTPITNLN